MAPQPHSTEHSIPDSVGHPLDLQPPRLQLHAELGGERGRQHEQHERSWRWRLQRNVLFPALCRRLQDIHGWHKGLHGQRNRTLLQRQGQVLHLA